MLRFDSDDGRIKFGIQPACVWNRDETFDGDVAVYTDGSSAIVLTRLEVAFDGQSDGYEPTSYSIESHA